MPANHSEIERRLWDAADELRANSRLKPSEYASPVLGLIFLRYADRTFARATQERQGAGAGGALYLPERARFAHLLARIQRVGAGRAIDDAMRAIEAANAGLRDALPKTYSHLDDETLAALLARFAALPIETEGDAFGKIYEYFLGKFAMSEGQKGGEFFTPTAIVKLIVEVLAPYHGRIFDPACGSGGMFVQSARFVESHRRGPSAAIGLYGQEKVAETAGLCRMNLAVHGLTGDIRQGNAYYEDPHRAVGAFDFVMANPPFNVDRVDRERIRDDPRYPLGVPRAGNANYLWIQVFYSALNATGRAGFVMANSAADAGGQELAIRRKLIEAGVVDALIAVGPNFFYTVTLPCTLWFLDNGKARTPRGDRVLFIDALPIYRQVDRAHRDFSEEQIRSIAGIVRMYRGERVEPPPASADGAAGYKWSTLFPGGAYRDVPGLCRAATLAEIAAEGWSLNPTRYVGAPDRAADDGDFAARLAALNEELEVLNVEARTLEERIAANVARLLEAAG